MVVGGICRPCSEITFSNFNFPPPAYVTSTLSPLPPGVSPILTTGPAAPPVTLTYSASKDTQVWVSLQGSDGTHLELSGTGLNQSVTFPNLKLSPPSPAAPITYTATFSYGRADLYGWPRATACPNAPPPMTITMPAQDAAGTTCNNPVMFGPNGNGPSKGPVTIVPILWGWGDPGPKGYGAQLDAIYKQIATSNYYAWIMKEYGAPALTTYPTVFTADPYPHYLSNNILSSDLKDDLNTMIEKHVVPIPAEGAEKIDAIKVSNPIYMIHLGRGVVARQNGSQALTMCVPNQVNAWNGHTGMTNLFKGYGYQYAVMHDPLTCPGQNIDSVTMQITHELIENVTDPNSGTAGQPGSGDGWQDTTQTQQCGIQIGDLCNNLPRVIQTSVINPVTNSGAITVQQMWSNKMGACVTEDALNVPFN